MSLLDLCQGASSLGLDALVQAICRKIRTATTASSIKELQEQEYARLIDSANAPIFGIDADGKVNVWNRCASRLMGYGPEDVMGNNLVQNFITKEYRALVQAVFDNALGVETANFEFPLVTKAGARVEVLLNATPRRDERGAVIGVVGIGQDITARINQEREYARLIDTANAPIFGVDVNGKVNVWNQCAIRMTGYTGEDVMGKHLVNEFITDDYKSSVQDVMKKALEGDETANFEFPLHTKLGARVQILLNATTRRDEHGAVLGVVGIGQDITARIAQEQEYARLIDTANAPIFGIDADGNVNVWNSCASRLMGYGPEDVMGNNLVQNFITKEYRALVQAVFDNALGGVETANFEFPLVTKAGARVEVLLNATPRRDERGAVIGVVGIGQDITARINQEREYARLIDTTNAPIFGVDVNGKVNVWNQCAIRMTGYTGEDVMGKHLVNEFITDDYKASVQDVMKKALEGVETANFEFPLHTKLGARVQILLNATTRRDEHGAVLGVVGIGQDITARIAQEQEYARLIDTANAPIFGIDANGNVNVWNSCAQRLTGYDGQDVMGKHLVNEFITPEYKAPVQNVFDSALEGVETANFEFPLITKQGTRIEVLLNATTRRDEKGRQIGVVGIGQDITARIAQEQEYARLIDTANAPIFGIDVNGHVNVWNQCASHLTSFAGRDVMGKHLVNEFITADYKESVQEVFMKALDGVETANFGFPLQTKQGTRVQILLNATTRRDEQGAVIGVVGIGQDITARIAQEQEYARLIDTANAPIFGVDANGNVNVWNRCASNLTGFGGQDVMGKHLVNEFITPEYKAPVQNVFDSALEGVETANFEFPLITKQGTRIEVLLNATTRRDEKGRQIGVVGIGQDITARIAQEQEYARLIDTANAPIFGIDVNGHVNVWNQCASNLTEFDGDEVMGNHLVREFIREEYRASVQNVFDSALNGTETANFEFPMITKRGARVEILLNATTRRDAMGAVVGVVGIGQDITARIAQEREYARLIDTANAPIFGVDVNGHVNVWNQCASNLTGFAGEEVMGNHLVSTFITVEYRTSVQDVLEKAMRGVETANFEFPLMNKDGTRLINILLNATTRRDAMGGVVGVVGIGQDISEARARSRTRCSGKELCGNQIFNPTSMQREAEAAQAAQATISAHVYHEIRNVVGAVLALADRVSEAVELALEEGTVAGGDDVAAGQEQGRGAQGAAPEAGKVMVHCHVLSAPAEGSSISKPAASDSDEYVDLVLAVADTGPGIATAQQQRVLLAFTTGDAPEGFRTSVVGGGGGGGGSPGEPPASGEKKWWRKQRRGIQLESPVSAEVRAKMAPEGGPGTLLWLVARMKRAPEPLKARLAAPSPSLGGFRLELRGRMRVLVVDDQRTMRQMVATLFQRLCQDNADLRVELHTCLSGEQAIRQAAACTYHVITMDEQLSEPYCRAVAKERCDREAKGELNAVARGADGLPAPLGFGPDRIENAQKRLAFFDAEIDYQSPRDGDGILPGHEAISRIREAEAAAARPAAIIFNLTGNVLESDRTKYTESGSNGVLPKPTKLSDLQNLLSVAVPQFLHRGFCDRRGDAVFMARSDLQIGTFLPPQS
ncbi:hypothetical protein JL722_9070 [Aureococcus anophagefferens]|nr:hypothetical protein JL722_9070 [Aureococcus anophagefferens]